LPTDLRVYIYRSVAFKEIPQRELREHGDIEFTWVYAYMPSDFVAFKEIPQRELRALLAFIRPRTGKCCIQRNPTKGIESQGVDSTGPCPIILQRVST
jgi:hypothetical protein